jgi:hypothetical protein
MGIGLDISGVFDTRNNRWVIGGIREVEFDSEEERVAKRAVPPLLMVDVASAGPLTTYPCHAPTFTDDELRQIYYQGELPCQ